MIGGAAASAINPGERAQVEPFDGFENEAGQVIFWQPVIQRWREQVVSLAVDRAKAVHTEASAGRGRDYPGIQRLSPTGC